jgi:hypothetical protein
MDKMVSTNRYDVAIATEHDYLHIWTRKDKACRKRQGASVCGMETVKP